MHDKTPPQARHLSASIVMAVTCLWWTVAALCSWVTFVILWNDKLLGRNLSEKGPICFCCLSGSLCFIWALVKCSDNLILDLHSKQRHTSHLFPILLFFGGLFLLGLGLELLLAFRFSICFRIRWISIVDEGKVSFISLFFPGPRCLPYKWDLNCYLSSFLRARAVQNRGLISQ